MCQSVMLNMANMMNVHWYVTNRREDLLVIVIRSKYGRGDDIIPKLTRKVRISNVQNGVSSCWDQVEKNISWRVGNGTSILFWLEKMGSE